MGCELISSGTRVSLTYTEDNCGVTPPGLNVDLTDMIADKTGGGAGFMIFDRTTLGGSFVVDGFVPEQMVVTSGFTDPANNAIWVVSSVTALLLTVYDAGDVGVDQATAVASELRLTMATLRATTRNVSLEIDTLESEEVRPSRQFSDVRHGFNQVTGSAGFELSNVSYTDFLRAAMSGEWETPLIGTPGVVTLTIDDPIAGVATFTRTTGSWLLQGFRPGDMIEVVDGTNPTNDGVYRVLTSTTLELEIDTSLAAVALIGGTTGVVSYPGARIDIGLNLRTFTMERRFDDIVQYQTYRGVSVNSMSLSVTPESIAGGSWDLLGLSATTMTPTSLVDGNLPEASPTNAPFAAFQGRVYENAVPIAVMTSMELNLNNNRTLEGVIGSKFSPGVFDGRASVDGTMVFFLQGNATYNKFVEETETSVWMRLADPNSATEFMNVVMPRVKFTTGDMDPPAEGPTPINMGFRSLETSVYNAAGVLIPTSLTIQSNPIR